MTGRKPFSKLIAAMPPESRKRAREKAAKLQAEMPLQELRRALDLSQEHLAQVLHVDQPAISKLERRTDMMLSTLGRFVEATGGRLEIKAVYPSGSVTIKGLAEVKREPSSSRH